MSAAVDREKEESQRQTTVPEQFEEISSALPPETRWGNDVNARDEHGSTPLMHAACIGCVEIVRLLIERGADVNARRQDGLTPLLLAAFFGHRDVVKILLESGADVDATSRHETSAEMWATARGFFTISDLIRETRTRADDLDSPARFDLDTISDGAANRNVIEESSSALVFESDRLSSDPSVAQNSSSETSEAAEAEVNRETADKRIPGIVTSAASTVVMSVDGALAHRTSASSRFAERFSEDGMPIPNQPTVDDEQRVPHIEDDKVVDPRTSEHRSSSIFSEEWYGSATLEESVADSDSSASLETAPPVESSRPVKRGTRVLGEDWEPDALPLKNTTESHATAEKKHLVLDEDWEPTLPPVESSSEFHPVMNFITRIPGRGKTLALLLVTGVVVSAVLTFVFVRVRPQINSDALLTVQQPIPPQQLTFQDPPSAANADAGTVTTPNSESAAPLQTTATSSATSPLTNETTASTSSDIPASSVVVPNDTQNTSLQSESSETVPTAVALNTVRRSGIHSTKPKRKTPPPPVESEQIETYKEAAAAPSVQRRTNATTGQNSTEKQTVDSSATGITSSKTRPKVIQWP